MTDVTKQLIAELERTKGSPDFDDCRHRCFARYRQTKDRQLRNALIASHMGVAMLSANRYRNRGVELAELEQVAAMGLIKVIERYDPENGAPFISFAFPTILGELRRYFRDQSWTVRPPRQIQERVLALNAIIGELTHRLCRQPTVEELAKELELTIEEVVEAFEADAGYSPQELSSEAEDCLAHHELGYDSVENWAVISRATVKLSARDRRILELRFVHEMTQSRIAREVGVSQMQVSRLLMRALAKLRPVTGPEPAPSQ